MYNLSDLKKDTLIQLDGIPFMIIESQHTKLGRGGAIVRTKIKNLLDGSTKQQTFKGNDKVQPASVDKVDVQFLYRDGQNLVFMDLGTYEQQVVAKKIVGAAANYLKEGTQIVALSYKNHIIAVEMPVKISLQVTYTEPGVQGDTAKAALKPATLETGAKIQVPLFIKTGDTLLVDTRTGSYIERVN